MIKQHMTACKESTALVTLARRCETVRNVVNYSGARPFFGKSLYDVKALWDKACDVCMQTGGGDPLQLYADARGISRELAKVETYPIRYGSMV